MEIVIQYGNETIKEISASEAFKLNTADKYCSEDIIVTYTRPDTNVYWDFWN